MISALRMSELLHHQRFQALGASLHGQDCEFSSVCTDSRSLTRGDVFVALVGEHFDGHEFVSELAARGAVAAIVERVTDAPLPQLQVSDTRLAYAALGEVNRAKFGKPLVGLTGSCGKTSCKEMIASILSGAGSVLATEANFNNEIGVPRTLLSIDADHDYAVVEMGASAAGEIAYLSSYAHPDVALLTNIAPSHLEGFGSIDAVADTKAGLFVGMDASASAVLNRDDDYYTYLCDKLGDHKHSSFGFDGSADFRIDSFSVETDGTAFTLVAEGEVHALWVHAIGKHNAVNAVAAAAVCRQLGISWDLIGSGLRGLGSVKGRMHRRVDITALQLIDDSYNANPKSVRAAIDALAALDAGRRILILGDMAELGSDAENMHADVGRYAADKIDCLFTVGVLSEAAGAGFGSGATHFSNKEDLARHCRNTIAAGDAILVKGSRSAKMENVVDAIAAHCQQGGIG